MHDDPLFKALLSEKVFFCENENEMIDIFEYIFDHGIPVGHATGDLARNRMQDLFGNYPFITYDPYIDGGCVVCYGIALHADVRHYEDFLVLTGFGERDVDLGGLMDAVFG